MSDRIEDLYQQTLRLGNVPGLEPRLEDLMLSRAILDRKIVPEDAVAECLDEQERAMRTGTHPLPRLADILASRGHITAEQLRDSLAQSGPAGAAPSGEGDRLGPYVKVSPLGRGAFGEVWKAFDTKLSRHVALKVMRQKDENELRRFLREAQTAASLSHPNIASVYQIGQEAGRHFIAMQLVDGQTLQTIPRHDLREAARIVRDAARAVAYAHEKGVVHRDLKPANIMLDKSGRVFVMDFGLAKRTDVKSSLSVAGGVLGTPAYMSPEQARSENADARSDVYSLGATLYELLADRALFRADDMMALLAKVAAEDPIPVRRRNARVPRDLDTVVMKCLDKDPRRRYDNAAALADDLTRFLEGEPISAHPPSLAYRLRKRLAKHRALTASVAAGLVGVAVVVSVLLPRLLRSERELSRRAALKPLEDAIRDARPYFYIPGADIRQKLQRVESAAEALARGDPDDGEICSVMGYGWYLSGDAVRAERTLRRALDDEPAHPRASYYLGRLLIERAVTRGAAAPAETARLFENARRGWHGAEEIDRTIAGGFHALARGDDAAVRTICDEAQRKHADGIGTEDLSMLRACVNAVERTEWLRKAVARRPHYAWAHVLLASALSAADPSDALDHLDAALRAAPSNPEALSRRGLLRLARGDKQRAAADLESALSLAPADWPDRATVTSALGEAQR